MGTQLVNRDRASFTCSSSISYTPTCPSNLTSPLTLHVTLGTNPHTHSTLTYYPIFQHTPTPKLCLLNPPHTPSLHSHTLTHNFTLTDAPPTHRDTPPTYRDVPPTHRDALPTHRDAPPTHRDAPPTHGDAHPLTETPHPLTETPHLLTETPHLLTETPHPLTEMPTHSQRRPTHSQRCPPTHRDAPPTHRDAHPLTETPHLLTETPHPLTKTPTHSQRCPTHSQRCPTHSQRRPTHSQRCPTHSLPQQAGCCRLQQVNTAQEETVTVEGLLGCGRRPEYHTMTQHLYLAQANTTTETSLVTYILTYVHIFSRYGHIHMHTDRSHDSHMTSSSQGSFHRLCSPA